jgi:hypothetical protein
MWANAMESKTRIRRFKVNEWQPALPKTPQI